MCFVPSLFPMSPSTIRCFIIADFISQHLGYTYQSKNSTYPQGLSIILSGGGWHILIVVEVQNIIRKYNFIVFIQKFS